MLQKQEYVLIKKSKDGVKIFDEIVNEFYLFTIDDVNICVRKEGNVVFDINWKSNIRTANHKKSLKKFLGKMYIAEMQREISNNIFKICDLNQKDCLQY